MNAVNNFVSNEIISALGWTLVNIIWQGFLVALVLAILLKIFKKFTSQFRYLMAISSFLLVVGLSVFSFISNYSTNNEIADNTSKNVTIPIEDSQQFTLDKKVEILRQDFVQFDFIKNVDKYFPIIVNIWFVGIMLFVLKFSFGLLYFQRIRKNSIQNINYLWIDKFCRIEQKLSLDKRIRYVESKVVKIPMVIGYLKPLIIIPAGMLSGIPENQIEAIVAHELAHIKRHDFLVNILQSVIEMVFFFHPAVWYISSVIRAERENCCDDIAIAFCDESITYAKALVSVQELNAPKVYHAVAFSGQKKLLLNRVKRVIMKPRMKSNLSDRIIAASIVVAGVFIATLSVSFKAESTNVPQMLKSDTHVTTSNHPSVINIANKIVVKNVIVKDTTKCRREHVTINIKDNAVIKTLIDKDGKQNEMKFTLKNGEVTDLYVDGKKIPKNEYSNYQPEIDKTVEDLKEAKEEVKKAMEEVEKIDIEKIKAEVAESMKDVEIDMAAINVEVAKAMEEAKNIDIEKVMKDVQKSIEHMESIDLDELQLSLGEQHHVDIEEVRKQMEEVRKQMENLDMEEIKLHAEKTRQAAHSEENMKEIQEEMQRVRDEMSKIDIATINIEVEKNLNKIDKEKILNEMQFELEKLEGLELEKK